MKSVIERMYKIGVIKLGDFRLKSGDRSPFYVDLRMIPSDPTLFLQVVDCYLQEVKSIQFDAIAGIMSAGVPFATAMAIKLSLPLLQIRSDRKEHGTKKMIEGIIPPPGSSILLVDDLISTGVSKHEPKQVLENHGLQVRHLIVFLDRTSQKTNIDLGMQLLSVINLRSLLIYIEEIEENNELKAKIRRSINRWDQKSTNGTEDE